LISTILLSRLLIACFNHNAGAVFVAGCYQSG
jgi:hypothetical protein